MAIPVMVRSKEEQDMGYLAFRSKVPALMEQLQERNLLLVRGQSKSPAQYLVACGILSVDKAYEAVDPARSQNTGMAALWQIYAGLKMNGLTFVEKGKERPLRFVGDVFEEIEKEDERGA